MLKSSGYKTLVEVHMVPKSEISSKGRDPKKYFFGAILFDGRKGLKHTLGYYLSLTKVQHPTYIRITDDMINLTTIDFRLIVIVISS